MFGHDNNDVIHAFARDVYMGYIQGLGIDLTVHGKTKELTELAGPYGGWSETSLVEVLTCPRQVVVIG